MAFSTVEKLKDPKQYKADLKSALGKVGKNPVKFEYFEKFPFADKPAPLLIVGHPPALPAAVVAAGAVRKAKGSCVLADDDLTFDIEWGAIKQVQLKEVLKGTSRTGAIDDGAARDDDKAASPQEAKHRAKRAALTKTFDAIKGQVTDDERKQLRQLYGDIDDAFERHDDAGIAKKLAELERGIASAVEALQRQAKLNAQRDDKNAALIDKAEQATAALDASVKKLQIDLGNCEGRLKQLTAQAEHLQKATLDLRNMAKAKQEAAKKQRAEAIAKAVADVKAQEKTIAGLKTRIVDAAKALQANKDQGRAKELLASFTLLNDASQRLSEKLRAVERQPVAALAADAGDGIKETVGRMAEASTWQKQQFDKAAAGANVHGSGRHGAQQGMDRAARRAVTGGFGADSANNPAGVTQHTKQWTAKAAVQYTVSPDGRIKVTNAREVIKHVVDEQSNYCKTFTQSMFANPVLEKEAVDNAVAIAKAKCPWTHVDDGGWKELKTLVVWVPKPKTAPGYGYEMKLVDRSKKLTTEQADRLVKQFESGQIKTIDKLLDQLNVELTKKPDDGGVKMIPHAKVVLERSDVNAHGWVAKTHFPDNSVNAAAWSIGGLSVRKGNAAVQQAPTAVV